MENYHCLRKTFSENLTSSTNSWQTSLHKQIRKNSDCVYLNKRSREINSVLWMPRRNALIYDKNSIQCNFRLTNWFSKINLLKSQTLISVIMAILESWSSDQIESKTFLLVLNPWLKRRMKNCSQYKTMRRMSKIWKLRRARMKSRWQWNRRSFT